MYLTVGTDSEISAVENELNALGSENTGITSIQMSLFQAICKDVSDPSPELIAKLNGQYQSKSTLQCGPFSVNGDIIPAGYVF